MIKIYSKIFSLDDFSKIVGESKAKGDLARNLGFDYYSGALWKKIFSVIEDLNISINHFDSKFRSRDRSKFSEKISKENLEIQINKKLSAKEIADYFNCSASNIRYWIKQFNLKLFRGAKGKYPKDYKASRKCVCGETDPNFFYGNKRSACAKCHNQYNLKRGQEKRAFVVELLGGKCSHCGFDKYMCSLDVHHLSTEHKDPNFASSRGWSKEKLIEEMKNCILLCKCCHAAVHHGDLILERI